MINSRINLRKRDHSGPSHVASFNNRGLAYFKLGEFQRAIQDFDQPNILDSSWPDVYESRAIAWRRLDDFDRAVANYSRVFLLDPTMIEDYVRKPPHRVFYER